MNEEEAHQKEICLNQLAGVCPERHCQNHHTTLPYLWQIHMFGKWVSFDDNQMLEERYCNLEDSARGKVSVELLFGRENMIEISTHNKSHLKYCFYVLEFYQFYREKEFIGLYCGQRVGYKPTF